MVFLAIPAGVLVIGLVIYLAFKDLKDQEKD